MMWTLDSGDDPDHNLKRAGPAIVLCSADDETNPCIHQLSAAVPHHLAGEPDH